MVKRRSKLDCRNFCLIPEREEPEGWGNSTPFKKLKQCEGVGCTTMIPKRSNAKFCSVCGKKIR